MQGRLHGLDGLRGIAALVVVVYHVEQIFELHPLDFGGYRAVDFFFVLSGYVMARTYEGRLQQGWISGFMAVRIRRLWPILAIGILLGIPVIIPQFPDAWVWVLLLNLALIPAGSLYAYPANVPAWSIMAELVANLIHAILLARLKTWQVAAVGLVAFVSLVNGTTDLGEYYSQLWSVVPRVLAPYCLGIVLYRTWLDTPPFRIRPALTILAFLASMALLPSTLTDLAFVALVCPLLIAGGLQWDAPRWAILGGAASYPLYAVHYPLLQMSVSLPAVALAILVIVWWLTPELRFRVRSVKLR